MQGTTCYTTTLVPPKLTSNPSRHFHQRECGPRHKQKKKKKQKKYKKIKQTNKKKKIQYMQRNRVEKIRQHILHTQTQWEFRHPQKQCTVILHTHEPDPHSTIRSNLGTTTPHPQQGKRTAAFRSIEILSTVTNTISCRLWAKLDTQ